MKLGIGGNGPWENRSHLCDRHPNGDIVAMHLNADHSVQRFRFEAHPGMDLLTVRRHDRNPTHPGWRALQSIKNVLSPDGSERFGYEVFPATRYLVDNCNLWHIWVLPLGEQPEFGLHSEQIGAVHV